MHHLGAQPYLHLDGAKLIGRRQPSVGKRRLSSSTIARFRGSGHAPALAQNLHSTARPFRNNPIQLEKN